MKRILALLLFAALALAGIASGQAIRRSLNLASSTDVAGVLPKANGGTATATPALVAGTNITITGTWPNNTISAISTATPASASAAGTAGTVAWDANFIYVCTTANTWRRVAIASW